MSERKGTRTVNEIVGVGGPAGLSGMAPLEIDPFRVSTWPEEQQRNHRLRRALHELMVDPRYRVEVGQKPDGSPGVRIKSEYGVPVEAQDFLARYREEFITYLSWLEGIDSYSGVTENVDFNQRKAA